MPQRHLEKNSPLAIQYASDFVLEKAKPEKKARDVVLRKQNATNRQSLDRLRSKLVSLYKRRTRTNPFAYVTADDARRIMAKTGIVFSNNNTLGSLFRTSDWTTHGDSILSTTPGSHANRLLCWRYVGE